MKRMLYVVVSLFLFSTTVHAVPKFLNYQGKLSDATGTPVANGTYQITFSIYDVSTGGTALWTETLNVPVNNGVFAVELGKVTVMPATLITAPSLFLGIKVGSDPEMTPRSPLHPVPKAFLSEKAEDADKLGGQAVGNFVLKIDPKWNVLSNDDGTVNNADSQHTHTVGSVSGTVLLAPSATQTIQPSGNFPPLAVKMIAGQTSPLIELINDAGIVMGSISSRGLLGKGGLDLLAEGPAPTVVSVSNPDASNVANLDVEGSVTAQKLTLISDPKWNLLTNQDGVVDNADTMHSHSGGGGGSVLLSPTTPQTIQPTADVTPLILKPSVALPTAPLFEVQDSSGVKKLAVMPDGHVFIPGSNRLHIQNIDNDSPTGPMGNMFIDVINNTGNSKLTLLNSDTSFTAGLSVEGNMLIGIPSQTSPKLSVEDATVNPAIAVKATGSGTALDVWNAGTGSAGVFSITTGANSSDLISGDHSGVGNLLKLSMSGVNKFVVTNTGDINFGLGNSVIKSTGAGTSITLDANDVGASTVIVTNNAGGIANLSVEGGVSIGTGVLSPTVNLNTKTAAGNTTISVQNPGGGLADLQVEGAFLVGTNKAVVSPAASQQMIQSGKNCEALITDGFVTITFPSPFTSAPNVVGTLDRNNSGSAGLDVFIQNPAVDVTSSAVTFRIASASSTDTECVYWIAVGN